MNTPYYQDDSVTLYGADALDVLRTLPDASVDAVVTDPPYGLADHHPRIIEAALRAWLTGDREHVPDGKGFMGREWDRFVPPPAVWDECWRVLKPGGHLLAFAGSRTYDLMSMSIRLAGFEIRDSIKWIYGQGLPKGQDIGKAIDRRRKDRSDVLRVTQWLNAARLAAGLTHKQVDAVFGTNGMSSHWAAVEGRAAVVPTLDQWERLRELLSFGDEMDAEVRRLNARKGDVGEDFAAREVVGSAYRVHRGSTVGVAPRSDGEFVVTAPASDDAKRWHGWNTALKPGHEPIVMARKPTGFNSTTANVLEHGTGAINVEACRVDDGRWPANVAFDDHAAAELDQQSGTLTSGAGPTRRGGDTRRTAYGEFNGQAECTSARGANSGGASRFFPVFRYEPKASDGERLTVDGVTHNTVKPLAFMRWLVRLVTPAGGIVLDPFVGSGTTAEACVLEGFRCIAAENHPPFLPLTVARLSKPLQPALDLDGAA